jgi:predicted dehydrogenase
MQTETNPRGIVVAGCGTITRITHGPDLAGNPDVPRIGWVDPVEANTAEMIRLYGGTAYVNLTEAIATEWPMGVVVATPPRFHYTTAMTSLIAGASILLEKGGKTVTEMRRIIDQAKANRLTVQMTFHQLLAVAPALAEVRRLGRFRVRNVVYRWLRQNAPGPDGAFEDLVVHGIAMVLEGFDWELPLEVRVERIAPEHYVVELVYERGEDPATIEVACNHAMPETERVEVTFQADEGDLFVPFRTTQTPEDWDYTPRFNPSGGGVLPGPFTPVRPVAETRTQQSNLWVASLGSGRLSLPVHGMRCLRTQVVLDTARESLRRGGRRVGVEFGEG